MEPTKRCRVCRHYKPRHEFNKDKNSWDGLQPKCKTCNRKLVREHRARKAQEKAEEATTNPEGAFGLQDTFPPPPELPETKEKPEEPPINPLPPPPKFDP